MTKALEGGEGSAARPGSSLPRERPGVHCTRGWVGPRTGLAGGKILPPPGFDPRTIQPVASRFTYWAPRPTQFYSKRSQFNNCWVAIVYQVTFRNILSKCPPSEWWTCPIMECHTLSKVPGRLRMVWQALQIRWWDVCPFAIGTEYTGVFNCSHRWHSKGLRSGERWGCNSKTHFLRTCSNVIVFLSFNVGNSLLKFVHPF
jgi:hypothetical protein